jgi:C-methyltransferase
VGLTRPGAGPDQVGALMEPHELIFSVTNAGVAARCLHVAAQLGVADHIDDRPVPAGDLAQLCNVDADGLNRVLRLLSAHGVFSLVSGGYQHSDASRLLRSDHPMSMRAFPQMMGLPVVLRSFDELAHSVRTGRPAIEMSDPDGLWAYLMGAPTERAVFDQAMTARAAGDTAAVLAAYDFSSSRRIVDVGGGRGHLLHAVLEATPDARGVLFDLHEVVEKGPAHPRLVRHAGDFFVDPLPAADTYLVMEVLHDWADAEVLAILTAVRRAATDDAKVLLIEGILPENVDPGSLTIDVIMLTVTGGRERTTNELGRLLYAAGFQLNRVIDTTGRLRIAEVVLAEPNATT